MEYKETVLRGYGSFQSLNCLTILRIVWYQMVQIRAKIALYCFKFFMYPWQHCSRRLAEI